MLSEAHRLYVTRTVIPETVPVLIIAPLQCSYPREKRLVHTTEVIYSTETAE